jgi:hypothetical protein
MQIVDHLEAIENAIVPLGGFVERMGGNCEGLRFNLGGTRYAIVTHGDNEASGDPEDFDWTVGLYDGNRQIELNDGATLADCLRLIATTVPTA